jgi:hypothetical protein
MAAVGCVPKREVRVKSLESSTTSFKHVPVLQWI